MALLKDKLVVESDPWTLIDDDAPVPAEGDVVVGLARFLEDASLKTREGRVGVRLDPADEIAPVVDALKGVPLVAIHFPKFSEGRGYSQARLLRERHGYTGELRAVGDVLADQLYYMQRCGIDAFALKDGKDPASALRCLSDLTLSYQGAADDPRPVYRRAR